MKPELKAYISTWTLATWRRYLLDVYKGAEIGKQALTKDQRRVLRHHVFEQFKNGVPGSPDVTGMVWAMLEAHKELWSHSDTKLLICPNCDGVSAHREIAGHERIKCAVCGKYSTRWQWREDDSETPEYPETNDGS